MPEGVEGGARLQGQPRGAAAGPQSRGPRLDCSQGWEEQRRKESGRPPGQLVGAQEGY